MTRTVVKIGAWLLLATVVVFTLGPGGFRPETGAPVQRERAVAYLVAGFLFAVAYPARMWWIALFLLLAICSLEFLQHFRPDRHGRAVDALAKIAGGYIGLGCGRLTARGLMWQRRRKRNSN